MRNGMRPAVGRSNHSFMDAIYYVVLIEVHFRSAVFHKGERLTLDEMGPYAFTLLHFALARPEFEVAPEPAI